MGRRADIMLSNIILEFRGVVMFVGALVFLLGN
jgi:hypothetical protein